MSISKAQALGIVFRSADTYAQELENRNLLFICVDKHGRTSAFETAFHDYNYQHLTGLETAQTLSAQLFYQACLNRQTPSTKGIRVEPRMVSANPVFPEIMCINIILSENWVLHIPINQGLVTIPYYCNNVCHALNSPIRMS